MTTTDKVTITDAVGIEIEPKIIVPKTTAEDCLKIVEIWANEKNGRSIEADYIDGHTVRLKLIGE